MSKETDTHESTQDNDQSTSSRVLALSYFCEVPPRLFEALLREFTTLDAIYSAEPEEFLGIEGIDEEMAELLSRAADHLEAADIMAQALSERDIGIVTRFDDAYSGLLFELNNPPSVLYYRGRMIANDQKSLAVIGSHKASSEGIELTSHLVKELVANQIQIVSSLVGGIDITAHLSAKSAGGSSYAVLTGGFDHIDGAEKLPVAIDIAEAGGVISEYPPETEPDTDYEVEANRLIAGMAQAVVVVEAYADSDRVLDLLQACRDMGKMAFFMVDSDHGALADKTSLSEAANCGAIPIEGFDRIGDIVKSLV